MKLIEEEEKKKVGTEFVAENRAFNQVETNFFRFIINFFFFFLARDLFS